MDTSEQSAFNAGFLTASILFIALMVFIYNTGNHDDSYIFKSNKACEKANSKLYKLYDDGDILCKNKASFSRYEVTHILQEDN